MNDAEKRITGLCAVMLALLVGTTAAAWRNINRSISSSDWVNHTHEVISTAQGIASSVNAAERFLRNFVLTGDERDRAACRRSFGEASEHLTTGKALTHAEPAQHAEFSRLEALVEKRVDFAREVINARVESGLEGASNILGGDRDETSEIHRGIETLKAEEEDLLRARDKESYLHAQNTRWIVFSGVAVNAGIVIFMVYLVRDDIRTRRRAAALLEESNARLDATIEQRTHELAAANEALRQENLEQRWSNQALDHQLRYNKLIINSIDSLVLVISKASNITRINPAVTRRTGFESQELVGGPLRRVLGICDPGGGGDLPRIDALAACLNDGRDLTDSPGILHDKDGRESAVSFSVFPLRDRDKVVGGVVAIQTAGAPIGRRSA